jgi:uncharacterized membrane protein YkoI
MAYSMGRPYVTAFRVRSSIMNILRNLLLLAALGTAATAPAGANPRDRNQDDPFKATQQGRIMPLRAIEARIIPRLRGFDYLGPEIYLPAGFYRLKFMRGGQVVWIDVDARTGEVLRKSGF